jgi:hypothetical protein
MRLCTSLLDVASDLEQQARLNFLQETDVAKVIGKWSIGKLAETQGDGLSH